jgi:DNA-binding IclR family transcriptional regulator
MKVSISRSVGRAFAILEAFRETRRPATATDISRRLNAPHSSVVAVLYNLCDLGYLRQDEEQSLFFPTTKLLDVAAWLRPGLRENGGRLGQLVDQVAADTGHTTVLSSRLSLFVKTVVARQGRHSVASGPSRSIGAALMHSVPGLVILSQMEDDDLRDIVRETDGWLRESGMRPHADLRRTLETVDTIRKKGYMAGAGHDGTEIMAYAVNLPHAAEPLALSVHVPAKLAPDSKDHVRQALAFRLRARGADDGFAPAAVPRWAASRAPAHHAMAMRS